MPGGVAGERPMKAVSYADFDRFYPYKTTGSRWSPHLFRRRWTQDFCVPMPPAGSLAMEGRDGPS